MPTATRSVGGDSRKNSSCKPFCGYFAENAFALRQNLCAYYTMSKNACLQGPFCEAVNATATRSVGGDSRNELRCNSAVDIITRIKTKINRLFTRHRGFRPPADPVKTAPPHAKKTLFWGLLKDPDYPSLKKRQEALFSKRFLSSAA